VGVSRTKVDEEPLNNRSEVETDQSWFWTDEWQERIAEAMNDLKEGRVKEFDDVEDLIADLNSE
jgi:hypothetical protein